LGLKYISIKRKFTRFFSFWDFWIQLYLNFNRFKFKIGHTATVYAVATSNNGPNRLFSGSYDTTVKVNFLCFLYSYSNNP